jgi:hypothetical protein
MAGCGSPASGIAATGLVIAAAQPLGRLGQQVLRETVRALVGAKFGLQHMLVADAFRIAGGGRLNIDAMQHLVEQEAVDTAPHPAQLERRRVPELGDGEDAGAVQPLLHARADAVDLLQLEAKQKLRQVGRGDDDEAVRLLHVGTDFGQKHIRLARDGRRYARRPSDDDR